MMIPWSFLVMAGLAGVAGVQTYRLNTYQLEEKARVEAEQKAALANLRNKERTDAQYKLDLATARRAGVRIGSSMLSCTGAGDPRSSQEPTTCFGTERLNAELTEFARQAEEVAAAFRACRAYVLDL